MQKYKNKIVRKSQDKKYSGNNRQKFTKQKLSKKSLINLYASQKINQQIDSQKAKIAIKSLEQCQLHYQYQNVWQKNSDKELPILDKNKLKLKLRMRTCKLDNQKNTQFIKNIQLPNKSVNKTEKNQKTQRYKTLMEKIILKKHQNTEKISFRHINFSEPKQQQIKIGVDQIKKKIRQIAPGYKFAYKKCHQFIPNIISKKKSVHKSLNKTKAQFIELLNKPQLYDLITQKKHSSKSMRCDLFTPKQKQYEKFQSKPPLFLRLQLIRKQKINVFETKNQKVDNITIRKMLKKYESFK